MIALALLILKVTLGSQIGALSPVILRLENSHFFLFTSGSPSTISVIGETLIECNIISRIGKQWDII